MPMRMRMTFAVLILLAAMACGKASSPMSPSTTVNARIVSGGFTPNPINISVGSSVMWTNSDSATHEIVADNGAFRSGPIAPGGQYSYTFPSAGTFTYHDASNPSMSGTVNVTGSSTGSPY
jgi:plastocyanin